MMTDSLMPKRYIGLSFTLDTNRVNARQRDSGMNQLERWRINKVIDLSYPNPAAEEAQRGKDSSIRSKKVSGYLKWEPLPDTPEERRCLAEIAHALLGGMPQNPNEWNDVIILFTAKKYHEILITEDGSSRKRSGGILKSREKLRALGIQVMSTAEAVQLVKKRIQSRDQQAREEKARTGEELPGFVGKD